MGMDAELLAIGKYCPEVVSALEYPPGFYSDTPVGATVITTVVGCCSSDSSRRLAAALGINPWSFEQHCDLSGGGVDTVELEEVFGGDVVACLLRLREHGFRFYYMPNG